MKTKTFITLFLATAYLCTGRQAMAQAPARDAWKREMAGLTPAIFSDHMVLQRQVPVPVWGNTEPGGTVTVTFMNQTKTAKADGKGKWMVKLDKMEAVSEPQEMTVKDAKETRVFKDVLVGEVWLGSGQSNMEWGTDFSENFKISRKWPVDPDPTKMGNAVDGKTQDMLRRAIGNPLIRVSSKTRDHLTTKNTGWERVDAKNAVTISALAGCIAIGLQEELKVPVGIIVRSVSMTAMARWMEQDAFLSDPIVKKQGEQYIADTTANGRRTLPALTGTAAKQGFGNLYREYILPVRPYAIRGFLWDQGESGIGYRGVGWEPALRVLVTSWRKAWDQGDLPWSATNRYDRDYSTEQRLKKLGVENFMIARTTGLSRALHPPNKSVFARKHLDGILTQVYGRPAPADSPAERK